MAGRLDGISGKWLGGNDSFWEWWAWQSNGGVAWCNGPMEQRPTGQTSVTATSNAQSGRHPLGILFQSPSAAILAASDDCALCPTSHSFGQLGRHLIHFHLLLNDLIISLANWTFNYGSSIQCQMKKRASLGCLVEYSSLSVVPPLHWSNSRHFIV